VMWLEFRRVLFRSPSANCSSRLRRPPATTPPAPAMAAKQPELAKK